MDPYQWVLNYFKLKRRSAPNSKNWHRYFIFFLCPITFFTIDRSPFVLVMTLISIVSSLNENYTPTLALIVLIMFRIYQMSEDEFNENKGWDGNELAYYIRIRHNQSLIERLHRDPTLIHATYKKKSLLYWCKRYKNLEAHKIIIAHLKKDLAA